MIIRSSAFVAGLAGFVLAAMLIPKDAWAAKAAKIEAAIRSLETLPSDAEKFQAYCNVLGEMEDVPEKDAAKFEALEGKLNDIIESYGSKVAQAWEVVSETDPDSADGKVIAAAIEKIEEKCP